MAHHPAVTASPGTANSNPEATAVLNREAIHRSKEGMVSKMATVDSNSNSKGTTVLHHTRRNRAEVRAGTPGSRVDISNTHRSRGVDMEVDILSKDRDSRDMGLHLRRRGIELIFTKGRKFKRRELVTL